MEQHTIALFGEAEKGEFQTAYFCRSLGDLSEYLGHPPEDSRGLHFAVQALMYQHSLIFFRVLEEGYSTQDYLLGLRLLQNQTIIPQLSAICMPGVGDADIIDVSSTLCAQHQGILVTTEADLYDYLTHRPDD
ncbi:hypothetical protein SCG7086_DH_00030 [Chlamydiales bacterium SCGC AG-110-P3]|nr:hypothetical protein SCG7086_DH_00030 [Chlamydiales bacterium SCGC AG-110-P3]